MDREEAIRFAVNKCPDAGYVLVSGKGTDPFIMEANGKKTPWSDAKVMQKVLQELSELA